MSKTNVNPRPAGFPTCKEKINSKTRLLAATYTFKILNKFGHGTTQKQIQEDYQVKPKQLSVCLTGRKYLGGSDRKAITRNERLQMSQSYPQAQSKYLNISTSFTCLHSPADDKSAR